MNPSVDDRLSSVLRALETVVLPALPPKATLAQEQVMLAIGQLQIIQAQRDAAPAFEQRELEDITAMAHAVLAVPDAPPGCTAALDRTAQAVANDRGLVRERTDAIRDAIDALLIAAHEADGTYHASLAAVILPLGRTRARQDRAWFGAMGFDAEHAPG